MEILEKIDTLYVIGNTCTGKTTSVLNYLQDNDYEYTYTSINLIKNEEGFKTLLNNNNILNILKKEKMQKVIVIDNIDYLQNNEKKLLNIIIKHIKLINKKKIKNNIKFIFIGIINNDKKIIELKKIVNKVMEFKKQIFLNDPDKNSKEIVYELLNNCSFNYNNISEKTIVSLIYHENIINCKNINYCYYEQFLKLFSIGDYYDRISFQKQLWQFNEITFFLKVINNFINYNKMNFIHEDKNIIFTKVLTKYSNEYSNLNYIIDNCNKLNCQKLELIDKLKNNEIDFISNCRLRKNLL